jgi:hypothetical protein
MVKQKILPPPKLYYAAQNPVKTSIHQPATWNLETVAQKVSSTDTKGHIDGKGFLRKEIDYPKIFILRVTFTYDERAGNSLKISAQNQLIPALLRYGLSTNTSHLVQAKAEDRRSDLAIQLSKAYNQLCLDGTKPPVIFVHLPNKGGSLYANVIWWADCVIGVSTICFVEETFEKFHGANIRFQNSLSANLW